jgi:isopropylmalate/homocitrate/citramalate synthase
LKHALDQLGVALEPASFEAAFARMKEVADQTGEVSPTRLQTIVDEVLSDTEMLQDVVESFQ